MVMNKRLRLFLILLFCGLLSACTVDMISDYNQNLVSSLEDSQQQLNKMLIESQQNIGKSAASYSSNQDIYNTVNATLATNISQVKAIPNSDTTLQQLDLLQKAIDQMAGLQKKGFVSAEQVQILQDTLNNDFTAIYQLQNAKQKNL